MRAGELIGEVWGGAENMLSSEEGVVWKGGAVREGHAGWEKGNQAILAMLKHVLFASSPCCSALEMHVSSTRGTKVYHGYDHRFSR